MPSEDCRPEIFKKQSGFSASVNVKTIFSKSSVPCFFGVTNISTIGSSFVEAFKSMSGEKRRVSPCARLTESPSREESGCRPYDTDEPSPTRAMSS